jgi:dienelactone hydrolase
MKTIVCLFAGLILSASVHAKLITRAVPYEHNGVKLEGYLAYDDAISPDGDRSPRALRPGILIAHEWWGLSDYERSRANQLAGMGYVAFALDMYGAGIETNNATAARELAQQFHGSPLMAERAQAGLDQLLNTGLVDRTRVAAIGYCFGGTTVLALAYTGIPLAAVVTFHGGLIPVPAGTTTHAKFLICHGAIDPTISKKQLDTFLQGMNDAKFDYEFISYAGAMHAFSNPDATGMAKANNLQGIGYNAVADRRSWANMQTFLREVFRG